MPRKQAEREEDWQIGRELERKDGRIDALRETLSAIAELGDVNADEAPVMARNAIVIDNLNSEAK